MPLLCQLSRLFVSLLVGIPSEIECFCNILGMSCAWLVFPSPSDSLRRVDCLVSGVQMSAVVRIVYGWPIEPYFLRNISNICHWTLWWWYNWWIHTLMNLWMWFPLIRGLPLQDGLLTAIYPPVGVSIGAESLDYLCPRIHPGVDRCLGLLPLH